ncbi:hypothetical protein PS15m_009448 [Mucor circinelloides]
MATRNFEASHMMVQTAQRDNVTFFLEANAPKICYKTLSNLSGDYRILHCPSINIWSVTFSHELDPQMQLYKIQNLANEKNLDSVFRLQIHAELP